MQQVVQQGGPAACLAPSGQLGKIRVVLLATGAQLQHKMAPIIVVGPHQAMIVPARMMRMLFGAENTSTPFGSITMLSLVIRFLSFAAAARDPYGALVGEDDAFVHQMLVEATDEVLRIADDHEVRAEQRAERLGEEALARALGSGQNQRRARPLTRMLHCIGHPGEDVGK